MGCGVLHRIRHLVPVLLVFCGCAEFVEDHHNHHYHEPEASFTHKEHYDTVGDVIDGQGCSTGPLKRLDLQIAKEMSCMASAPLKSIENVPGLRMGAGVRPHLQRDAAEALIRATERLGGLVMTSGWRSVAQQYVLKSWQGSCGISIAAQPGRSQHQSGLAIDTGDFRSRRVRQVLAEEGFRWYCDERANGRLGGCADPVHFEFSGSHDLRDISVLAFQKLWNRNNPADLIEEDGYWGPSTARRLRRAPVNGFPIIATCDNQVSEDPPSEDTLKCDGSEYPASFGYERCDTEGVWRCACSADLGETISQVCRGGVWVNHHLAPSDCGQCNAETSAGCRASSETDSAENSVSAQVCGDSSLNMSESGDTCSADEDESWRCACVESIGDIVSQVCRDGEWINYRLNPRDCGSCDGSYSNACEP